MQRQINAQATHSNEQNRPAVYIARQPIFNNDGDVCAYELLYRDTETNAYNAAIDNEVATGTVISESILNFGMGELTNGKKAFVNFSEGSLLHKAAYLLDSEQFVIEILEHVVFTPAVMDSLYTLKAAGFSLALDDYSGMALSNDILYLIDMVKIDFIATTKEVRASFVTKLREAGITLLAEKVETKEDVDEAISLGCELFQGYYFSKPVMLKKTNRDISSSSYYKLTKEVSESDLNLNKLAWIIHWDAHLTYKLLKKMKTLQYYRGNAITSIKRALVMMGEDEVRRWVMLVLIREIIDSKSDELIRTALIRAFLCEKLARELGKREYSAEAFSTGILSIIQQSEKEELMKLQIPPLVKDALSGTENLLKVLLDISRCYENGNWESLELLSDRLSLPIDLHILPGLYFMSVSAADEMLAKDED